jgi:hypothetical protein
LYRPSACALAMPFARALKHHFAFELAKPAQMVRG